MRTRRTARWGWVVWLLLPALFLVGCGRRGGSDRGGGIDLPEIGIELTSGGGDTGGTDGGDGGSGPGSGSGSDSGSISGSGGDSASGNAADTSGGAERTDPAQDAFRAVTVGSCLPVHRNGEEWSTSVPPAAVSCRTERAGLFQVTANYPSPTSCPTGVGRATWNHRSAVTGETSTLCLNRVWVTRYCVLAEQQGEEITSIGDTTAVDCDATQVPVPYNQVLVVAGAYQAPSGAGADHCVTGANDHRRYWSLLADGGDTLVCFTARSS